jgi:hypothetical protein
VLSGVETAADLAGAEALGVDAVMMDSPRTLRALLTKPAAAIPQFSPLP